MNEIVTSASTFSYKSIIFHTNLVCAVVNAKFRSWVGVFTLCIVGERVAVRSLSSSLGNSYFHNAICSAGYAHRRGWCTNSGHSYAQRGLEIPIVVEPRLSMANWQHHIGYCNVALALDCMWLWLDWSGCESCPIGDTTTQFGRHLAPLKWFSAEYE